MRIGIDASRYFHETATGVEWYSWHIIKGILKEADKDDQIVLYSREKLLEIPASSAKVINKILPAKRLWTLCALSKEMRKNPPDSLFVPSHVLPLSLPKRSVITIHDVAFKYLRRAYPFFQYHYLNWSTKFAIKHASKIIVPSRATAHDLKIFFKCPEDKLAVIPHGFDKAETSSEEINKVFKTSEVFKYFGIHKEMNYILFVGRLETKKNLERLVKAFKNFTEVHGDYKLVLAGKRGTGFNNILKTIDDNRIMDKVIMPGYITEEEKAALYKYCRIFAFPSLYEGFGLPILEAFYYGKPVLTSRVSCLPEVGGESVHYVDPYDEEDILSGLDKLTNDKQYRKKLVESGTERLKQFSWKLSAERTLSVITSVSS